MTANTTSFNVKINNIYSNNVNIFLGKMQILMLTQVAVGYVRKCYKAHQDLRGILISSRIMNHCELCAIFTTNQPIA